MTAVTQPSGEFDLRAAMAAAGIDPGAEPIISDGRIHRFRGPDDKEKDSWFIGFESGAAVFGNWRLDLKETFVPNRGNGHRLTGLELKQIEEARQAAEAERQRQYAEAAVKAREIFEAATIIVSQAEHQYLVTKNVQPYGKLRIRRSGDDLIVPMLDVESRELVSLQRIGLDGRKLNLEGGRAACTYFPISDLQQGEITTINVGEGYSTAATIHEATHEATVVAFGCGNLPAVAAALRKKHPQARIVICADDNRATPGNPGLTKAREAARAVGGLVAVPNFIEPTADRKDFNDMAAEQGLDAVRELLESVDAQPVHQADVKFPFRLTGDSLEYAEKKETKNGATKTTWHRVCSRIEIHAATRSERSEDWGRVLVFKDSDGREHEWSMPQEMLAGDGTAYRALLLSKGLIIAPSRQARDRLHEYISATVSTARARAITRVGWCDEAYVMTEEVLADA